MEFDKHGKCYKCGGSVHRLRKSKTWHHVEQSDYIKCGYVQVKRDSELLKEIIKIEKKLVKDRTEEEHLILIRKYGGVREYLLSMGSFKDVDIDDDAVEHKGGNDEKN